MTDNFNILKLNQMPDSKKSNKLQQFLDELEELCKRYQYSLVPVLQLKKTGLTPGLEVIDRLPIKNEHGKPKRKV